ncbi:hypothetical protein X801_09956 [Opisthorchis viverrini]|uniref:DUF5641 domain-containing protein n=1 Tax=Opisthorchis viverrini TaxID=6198 RepID=A0A1S8WIH6_OPIVI|nr:hypothetical protein X801_09956 [Opisthorchis viverrini]
MPFVGHLQMNELTEARVGIIGQLQAEVYSDELTHLKADTQSEPTRVSVLRKLCPILLDRIFCVGGRLHYSSYALSLKRPPILLNKYPVTYLLIRHYHEAEGHSGASRILGVIRQNVWIVHGSQAVKRVLHKCMQYRKCSRNICRQIMAPLPPVRSERGRKCSEAVERLTRRWKQVNYLLEVFWKRWMKEYTLTLQLRHRNRNPREGDVVMVVSENPSRGRWPLGIVAECQTDADGLDRTVSLLTSSGVIKRDVRSLCLLEGEDYRGGAQV